MANCKLGETAIVVGIEESFHGVWKLSIFPCRSTKTTEAPPLPLFSFFFSTLHFSHFHTFNPYFNLTLKMKIFDWVHRRFAHKDGLTESGRKNCAVDDGDSFNHNNALNVFDDWKEGILTIGTLGYDPLKDEAEKQPAEKEIEIHGGEITDSEEEDEVDEEEANAYPLVYAAAAAAAAYAHDCEALLGIKGDSSNRMNDEFDFESEFDAMIMNIPKKERITLAELFTADSELFADDSEKKKKKKLGDQKLNKETKPNSNKNGFSFAKKLIGDKDARPIQKLHRLMRMMMNRKIHPDEGMDGVKSSDKSSSETASLLPTQVADAMI